MKGVLICEDEQTYIIKIYNDDGTLNKIFEVENIQILSRGGLSLEHTGQASVPHSSQNN